MSTENSEEHSNQELPMRKPKMGNMISRDVLTASIYDRTSQGNTREQQTTINKPKTRSPASMLFSNNRDHSSIGGDRKDVEDMGNQESGLRKIKTGSPEKAAQITNGITKKEPEYGQLKRVTEQAKTKTPRALPKKGGWTTYEDFQLAQFIKARRDLEKKTPGMPVLRDEKLFRLVASQLQAVGIYRTHAAAKNHWNREGRENAQFEERVGKHTKSLVTSAQVPKASSQKGQVVRK
ncbi:hypothetical protein BGZ60DRAFT_415767 [Tricladium varicosporioides]|nr:hypothetical protein BGZ60DRAFT_415767 [Hymenoscyphus varicosporioides]